MLGRSFWLPTVFLVAVCIFILSQFIAPKLNDPGNYEFLERRVERTKKTNPQILDKIDQSLSRRTDYIKRENMSSCPPLFGKIIVFVAFVKSSMETHYKVAQESLQCYLKGTNYTVEMVDLDNDVRVQQACFRNKQLFFKKHCAAAAYLQDSDWMFVLDADTGVVNPNHCLEEYIDDRVDILFYERFFNWEIASGNYIIRNSKFSRNFLKAWGDWEFKQPSNWNGADNGVLQMHILQTVLPYAVQEIKNCDDYWHKATNYESYMAFVTCVKLSLGATRIWPGKIRIYKRAHGWVRDGFITSDRWCEDDFMFHGWKANEVGFQGWESPFNKNLNVSLCGKGYEGWDHLLKKRVSTVEIRKSLAMFETSSGRNFPQVARVLPHLQSPDVGECFPLCDRLV
ncbi:unnamed protein product [Caenorhabditis auriculariae]|uniref:Nucleotide-diphospho-sugar transferase domain-containing protein n=1 Tax=Caenorhabditis auriculariae TaxID=2777116 RepID=A0A8S1H6Y1_9PELO|nr:unnamed protein product [Caenorhabditis auriculariae]